jgi:hypothetical protein
MIKVQLTVETIKAPGGAANKPHIKVCVSPLREDAEAAALQKAVDTTLTKALGYATAAKLDSAEVHTNARRPTACGAALRVFISCHVRRRAYDGASAAMPHSEGTSQARNALAASLCPPRRFCKRAPALAERATRRLHLPRRLRQLHRRSAHRHGPSVQHDVRACIAHLSRMLTPASNCRLLANAVVAASWQETAGCDVITEGNGHKLGGELSGSIGGATAVKPAVCASPRLSSPQLTSSILIRSK